MSIFLALMAAGLTGLIIMALPGLNHHFHLGHGHGAHLPGHAGHVASGQAGQTGASTHGAHSDTGAGIGKLWLGGLTPTPRTLFSLLTLVGAFGYAFAESAHFPQGLAALSALIPAYLIERFIATPLWNLLLGFQAKPDTPLESLVLHEAEAVTPFANGRGIVSVVRDGRRVQFPARLEDTQSSLKIHVGDKLQIENVDAENERLTVTLRSH